MATRPKEKRRSVSKTDYVNLVQAGRILDVHPRTVSRMIARGELSCVKAGKCKRILRSDIDALRSVHS